MKSKLTILFIIAAISTLLFACSPASQQASIEVSCDDFYQNNHITKEVQVASGNSFTVTLCSNPTTGFQWSETAQISDQTVLQQIDHKFVSAEETGVVGAPGQEVWTFKALKKGTTSLSLEYSQPWEGGGKGEWTFNLTVVVK
jgi:inhibitor of cysteine peptidase